ncbi:MAG: beta-ketoacyl-ACP synthase II [Fibrobacteria bacterium]|nr:beta-ketoacyl-ACP synthase II [Fibrobacteria bacterium]
MNKEVVVTGLGVVSSLGNSVDELFNHLIAGKSGIASIERFDTEKFPVKFGSEVTKFDPPAFFSPKEVSRTSRYVQYIVSAAHSAVEMAGLDNDNLDKTRAGVICGSGMGGIEVFTQNAVAMTNRNPSRVSPFFIPQAITNMGSGTVAISLGWMGPNWSVSSACATGNHSIMNAVNEIRGGRADVIIAGGAEEAICPAALAGFANMRALSRRNDAPEKASRPCDKDRDGFVLAEGAATLCLESREHAEARGATILGIIKGFGSSCDAHHISAPLETGDGVALAINSAIKDADIAKEDIGLVNGHMTSTPLGDAAEVKAIKKIFGTHTQDMLVHSTKSMIGHLLGAASAIEAVVTIMCLKEGKIHPTINVENQDPECDVNCVPNTMVEKDIEFGISNSFGFGGHNSCVIFQKP